MSDNSLRKRLKTRSRSSMLSKEALVEIERLTSQLRELSLAFVAYDRGHPAGLSPLYEHLRTLARSALADTTPPLEKP